MDDDPMAELPADIKQNMTRYKAPPGLERRIRHMVALEPRESRLLQRLRSSWMRWVPVAASFACGVLMSVAVVTWLGASNGGGDGDDDVIASHLRSLQANHLMDVASSDRHTVKPWFTGKLDYAPPVIDLVAQGFPLAGGRLDYLDGRPVAALVYRHGGHTINVFVQPGPAHARRASGATRQGFQLADWEQGGMRFRAVSDVGRDEMEQFVAAMRAAG